MKKSLQNPYALYVYCDGAMDYGSKNPGGVGLEIIFPEFVGLESIRKTIGRYERANIERIELEAILRGMHEVLELFDNYKDQLRNIRVIIFMTDRLGLNDKDKTSPYRIRDWRKNDWKNYEGKAIKNSDQLEKIDKARKKIADTAHCSVEINYGRRKFNKTADKLAKVGKKEAIAKDNIALKGIKIGKRKFDDIEVEYKYLHDEDEFHIRVYKKEPIRDQWEISVEICNGKMLGKKIKIYSDAEIERKLHRHHEYKVRIKQVFTHHVAVYSLIEEVNNEHDTVRQIS